MFDSIVDREVIINLKPFYYVMYILPVLVIVSGVTCSYVFKHNNQYSFLPTLSEMMVTLPERRIFSIGMSLEAIFLLVYGIFRDHIFRSLIKRSYNINVRKAKLIVITENILLVIGCCAMITFAVSPVKYYRNTHNISTAVFFISLFLYFLINDYLLKYLDHPPKIYQWVITACIFLFMILFIAIRNIGPKNNSRKIRLSVASVFEFLGIGTLFLKVVVSNFTVPMHYIRVSKRD